MHQWPMVPDYGMQYGKYPSCHHGVMREDRHKDNLTEWLTDGWTDLFPIFLDILFNNIKTSLLFHKIYSSITFKLQVWTLSYITNGSEIVWITFIHYCQCDNTLLFNISYKMQVFHILEGDMWCSFPDISTPLTSKF